MVVENYFRKQVTLHAFKANAYISFIKKTLRQNKID